MAGPPGQRDSTPVDPPRHHRPGRNRTISSWTIRVRAFRLRIVTTPRPPVNRKASPSGNVMTSGHGEPPALLSAFAPKHIALRPRFSPEFDRALSRQPRQFPLGLLGPHSKPFLNLLHNWLHKLLTVLGRFCPLLARSLGIWVAEARGGLRRDRAVTSDRDNEKGRLSTCDNRPNGSGREALAVNHDRPLGWSWRSPGAPRGSSTNNPHRSARRLQHSDPSRTCQVLRLT